MREALMIITMHLAWEYIPRRMQELGYGKEYFIRLKHLVLQAGEQFEIPAYNQLYILLEEPANISVNSDFGVFDMNLKNTNQLEYEHSGKITVKNNSEVIEHVRFIMVIPKLNTNSDA